MIEGTCFFVGARVISRAVVSRRMTQPDIYIVGKYVASGASVDICLLETVRLFQESAETRALGDGQHPHHVEG